MANAISLRKERDKLINHLKKHTHFNKAECDSLAKKYDTVNDGQPIPRDRFRDFLFTEFGITDDKLLDKVFRVFDQNNDNAIDLKEWIIGLSIYIRGSGEEQRKFVFQVYENKNRGVIQRDDMLLYLKQALDSGKQAVDDDPDEGVSELIDIVRKKFNGNNSEQNISWTCFDETVTEDHLLLECLGPCMPCYEQVERFEKCVVQADQSPY